MTPAATSTLITQVELALLAGRNLDQIESEILESSEDDEELRAAAWLYAWSCTEGARSRRPLAATDTGTFRCRSLKTGRAIARVAHPPPTRNLYTFGPDLYGTITVADLR